MAFVHCLCYPMGKPGANVRSTDRIRILLTGNWLVLSPSPER